MNLIMKTSLKCKAVCFLAWSWPHSAPLPNSYSPCSMRKQAAMPMRWGKGSRKGETRALLPSAIFRVADPRAENQCIVRGSENGKSWRVRAMSSTQLLDCLLWLCDHVHAEVPGRSTWWSFAHLQIRQQECPAYQCSVGAQPLPKFWFIIKLCRHKSDPTGSELF